MHEATLEAFFECALTLKTPVHGQVRCEQNAMCFLRSSSAPCLVSLSRDSLYIYGAIYIYI